MVAKLKAAHFSADQNWFGWALLATLLFVQTACTSTPVSESRLPPDRQPATQPLPESESTSEEPFISDQPALLALLDESAKSRSEGDLALAISYVERALRIKPKNAELWLELAQLHLEAMEYGEAEQVARKALLFTQDRIDQTRNAWLIIATALEASGDKDQAAIIRKRWRRNFG